MRASPLLLVPAGAVALAWLALAAPIAAADGWRAAFLLLSAPPLGAVALLLVARIVGADWDAALAPLLRAVPWIALPGVPVVIGQALFHRPPGHLHDWLGPLPFLLRSALALLFWGWTARALARDTVTRPGPLLLAHGAIVSVMGYDWLLGVAPAQPNSAAPMILATMQMLGACALACAAGLGTARMRADLGYLLVALALGLAYLLYVDFAIVWFGNLPDHVGWYVGRARSPLPALALVIGLLAPILLVGLGRSDAARRWAGRAALIGLGLVAIWFVAGGSGWCASLAALAGVAVVAPLGREAWS